MDDWLIEHLVCPRDRTRLRMREAELVCDAHHVYPRVGDIPVMLTRDLPPTLRYAWTELDELGSGLPEPIENATHEVDPVVQEVIAATNGYLYRPLVGRLKRYPIPTLRLPTARGDHLLDVGCNWGRWVISAARLGYRPVGLDPSLGAVLTAQRVAQQLGVQCALVVGDARALPFADRSFERVFSYSVLQHFSKPDARTSISQIARVLSTDGSCTVQMPNKFGIRSLQHQFRLREQPVGVFDVRYWSPAELVRTFNALVGPATLSVDGYFGLGIQAADLDLLPARYQMIVRASELLRKLSQRRALASLVNLADSLYVSARARSGADDRGLI